MRGIPTPSTDCSSAEPSPIFPYRPRPETTKRSPSLQRKSHISDLAISIARLGSLRPIARIIVAVAPFMCMVATSTLFESSACAQTASRPASTDRFAKFVEEASDRFAVPARWIRAVIRIESGGDEHSISPRGAMGLMQLMPGTWVGLTFAMVSVSTHLTLTTTYWRAPPISKRCTTASDQQASLRLIMRVRRGTNSTLQRANRFRRKPWPMSRR